MKRLLQPLPIDRVFERARVCDIMSRIVVWQQETMSWG